MSTQPQEDILAQQKEEDIHKMLICKVCNRIMTQYPFLVPHRYSRPQLQDEALCLQEGH